MLFRLVTLFAIIFWTLPHESRAQGGYEEGGSYEAAPHKTKFNIGFNLPAMSISLPKLELPQISIKASVKNKKPFTLKLPIIKFNAHASSEDDNEYGGGYNGGSGGGGYSSGASAGAGAGYGEGDGSYSAGAGASAQYGPSAYASSPNGVSGYANAIPEMPVYTAASANHKVGYERPAAGHHNEAAVEQPSAYASSTGYGQQAVSANQHQNSPDPYANANAQSHTGQSYQQQVPQKQQQQSYAPRGYTPQAHQVFTPQHNYQQEQQPAAQLHQLSSKQITDSLYQGAPAVTANGYYVPRPVSQANQVPEYKDENIKYYQAAPLHQSPQSMPSGSSGPLVEEFYGTRLRPSPYGRRSTRPYLEHIGSGVFLAAASDGNRVLIRSPYSRMDTIQWSPMMQQRS